jgi:dTDP-4-dehydrorhamnose reductase
MKILVTGKNGQLGQSIHKVVNSKAEINNNLNSHNFVFVGREELDLTSKSNIDHYFDRANKFDVIINCAAYTAVDKAEDEIELANQVNHLAVKQLAEVAKMQKAKLIHISTDYVFDGESDEPYTETDRTSPVNAYGQTKLDGEKAVTKCMINNALIIRSSWLYSQFGNNFVKTMLRLGKERDELSIVSDQIGSPTCATDLAEVIFAILNNENYQNKENKTEIYHYSNEGKITWYEFAQEIFKISGIMCKINKIQSKDFSSTKRPKYSVLNNSKIITQYKITKLNWKKSLERTLI